MKEQVIEILNKIIHPETEKGIVDSNLIEDIAITDEGIRIVLVFPKSRDPFVNSIKRQVIEALTSAFPNMKDKISVIIKEGTTPKASTQKKEQESALERLSVESEGNRKTFMSLSADLAAREAELAENSARFRSLNEKLEMLRPYAPMYSSFKSINGLLGTVVSCRKTIGDLDCRLKKAEDTLKKAGEDYSAQADSLENMRQTRNSMQKELEAMYSAISAMDKEGKTRARNDLDDRMSLVKEAGMSVREMLKASDRKSKETAMLQSYNYIMRPAKRPGPPWSHLSLLTEGMPKHRQWWTE